MDTWEYLNGKWLVKKEPFRKYPSYMESFQDNAHVLKQLLSKRAFTIMLGLGKAIQVRTAMQLLG